MAASSPARSIPERLEIAKRYFAESPHGHKIEIRLWPGVESLKPVCAVIFDLCFIDADKENYGAYYDRCMELTRPRGLIIWTICCAAREPSIRKTDRAAVDAPTNASATILRGERPVAGQRWNHVGAEVVSLRRSVSINCSRAASNRKIFRNLLPAAPSHA